MKHCSGFLQEQDSEPQRGLPVLPPETPKKPITITHHPTHHQMTKKNFGGWKNMYMHENTKGNAGECRHTPWSLCLHSPVFPCIFLGIFMHVHIFSPTKIFFGSFWSWWGWVVMCDGDDVDVCEMLYFSTWGPGELTFCEWLSNISRWDSQGVSPASLEGTHLCGSSSPWSTPMTRSRHC